MMLMKIMMKAGLSCNCRLVELGRQKSYITIDDILHFFPEAEQDVEQLEEAFAALMSAGIPYIEDETHWTALLKMI